MEQWRKSSYSNGDIECVEVALEEQVGVRDSKDVEGGELRLSVTTWAALMQDLS